MPRFHVGEKLQTGAPAELSEAAAHHVLRVLRLREGDALVLFDGNGGEWDAEVHSVTRNTVSVAPKAWRDVERESPLRVTLVQGISSGERMDLTVQKAVELGVAAIQPVLTKKSVVRLEGPRAEGRVEHWRRVAISACEQCGRNRVPEIRPIRELPAYCSQTSDPSPRLLLAPGGQSLREIRLESEATLAAGPEAGFAPEEAAMLERAGFAKAGLGPRVLRTETAALAALAALNALRGDF